MMTTKPQILDKKDHPNLRTKIQVGQRCTVNIPRSAVLDNRPDDGTETPAKYVNLNSGEIGIFLGNVVTGKISGGWRYFEVAAFPHIGRVVVTDGILEPVEE